MTDHIQFDADLTTIGWSTPIAAEQFGKDPRWIARMRKGEVALNPEIAAWARKTAAKIEPLLAKIAVIVAEDPPPKPPRVWRGPTGPRTWQAGRRRKGEGQGEAGKAA